MSAEISIIVPVFNVEVYLNRCLDSIKKQTYNNIEIVLVDDGSTDASGTICDEYAKLHEDVIVIHKDNMGLGMARNTGLNVAKGKYVMFVDSDDYLEEDFIESLYNDIRNNAADTCIGGYKRIGHEGEQVFPNPLSGECFSAKEIKVNVLSRMFGKDGDDDDYLEMSVWKTLFSNSIIQRYGIRFPSERELISEDIVFDTDYYRYAQKVYMSNAVGYCYCDNDGSLTTRYRPDRFEKNLVLYNELSKRAEELEILDLINQRIKTNVVSIARYCIKHEVKYNNFSTAISNIRQICYNHEFNNILNNYNQSKVKCQSRVVNYLMQKKSILLLYIVSKFKLLVGA